jgi:predicted ATP-grasp superfamily ATP-dependent carboligase
MKAMCVNWKDYESTAGPVTFCELAAFNKKVEAGYLETIGCTSEKRKVCAEKMEMTGGFGLVPEVSTEVAVKKDLVKEIAGGIKV